MLAEITANVKNVAALSRYQVPASPVYHLRKNVCHSKCNTFFIRKNHQQTLSFDRKWLKLLSGIDNRGLTVNCEKQKDSKITNDDKSVLFYELVIL
jgi:hypothetical protein